MKLSSTQKHRISELAFSLPTLLWFSALFIAPTILVVLISFEKADSYGTRISNFSLDAWKAALQPQIYWLTVRTLFVSLSTSIICIALAIPTVFYMITCSVRWRFFLLLAMILPFWTSFLVRIFAWKYLLHPEGLIRAAAVNLGLMKSTTPLLYSLTAVIIVMIYSFLPFAVLPIYAAAEKFDLGHLEAASDLGASKARAFFTIFIPCVRKGLERAFALVFIPSIGSYVIPDLVGGVDSDILGNKIMQRTLVDRNLPQASALSTLLFVCVFAFFAVRYLAKKLNAVGKR